MGEQKIFLLSGYFHTLGRYYWTLEPSNGKLFLKIDNKSGTFFLVLLGSVLQILFFFVSKNESSNIGNVFKTNKRTTKKFEASIQIERDTEFFFKKTVLMPTIFEDQKFVLKESYLGLKKDPFFLQNL